MGSLSALRDEAVRELTRNILPFTMRFVVDWENGGFFGHVANDRTVKKEAPKAIVQHGRILWTFARCHRGLGDPQYLPFVVCARRALMSWFWDREHGGFYWMVDYRGEPVQPDKYAFGQAFAIFGLAEDYHATGNAESLDLAMRTYRLLEARCLDPKLGGYWEACHRDWAPAPELRVDDASFSVAKGMNTHLHLLEAYTNLLRVCPSADVKASLQRLLDAMIGRILNPQTNHLWLFFDPEWHPLSDRVSYGHDIEASWLLVEAAEALEDAELLAQVRQVAVRMAYRTLEEGVDSDGGVFDEGDPRGVTKRAKDWWPQAEAIVGFLNAYRLEGDPRFRDAALAAWGFVRKYLVDREYGDWFWGIDEAGRPSDRTKAGPWKGPYHNGRACLEIMERVPRLRDTT